MPRRTVLLSLDMTKASATLAILLAATVSLATGFPAPQDDDGSAGPLPFLQFTKGGIRVNFGGYHAQAGLGGLLTGSRADGGLHASAGTPDGAHASAGLGGSLNGGPSGGLYARAGLGNGGPESEAGLSGSVAGQPRGQLYAKSSPGGGTFVGVEKSSNWIERTDKTGDKNIQVIVRPKKATGEEATALVSSSADANIGVPVANLKEPSSSSPSSSSSASSGTTANAGASVTDGIDEASSRAEHPARWYFRERLRERAGGYFSADSLRELDSPRVTGKSTTVPTHNAPSVSAQAGAQTAEAAATQGVPGSQGATAAREVQRHQSGAAAAAGTGTGAAAVKPGVFVRASAGTTAAGDASDPGATTGILSGSGAKRHKGSLFDDIFNIPISALNAVNQLLRNHVGKK